MSVGGGHQLVHSIRMVLEQNTDFVCVKMDFENAHTSVFRVAVVEALLAEPSLCHPAWHAACVLAPSTVLESKGKPWGEQAEGGTLRQVSILMLPSKKT